MVCGKSRRNTLVSIYVRDFPPPPPCFDVYLDAQNKHDQYIILGDHANKIPDISFTEGTTKTTYLGYPFDWLEAFNLTFFTVLNTNESLLGVSLISGRA